MADAERLHAWWLMANNGHEHMDGSKARVLPNREMTPDYIGKKINL